jgi:hypothetical protein
MKGSLQKKARLIYVSISLDVSAYSYDISMVFCCNNYCWWNYSEIFPYETCLLGNDS